MLLAGTLGVYGMFGKPHRGEMSVEIKTIIRFRGA